jgi:hypothetical protein
MLSYGFVRKMEEGVGVEPTEVIKLRRFSGPLGVAHAQPSRSSGSRGSRTHRGFTFARDVSSVVPYH